MKPKSADILILHGTILTMDIKETILNDGGLAIVKDRIAAIGSAAEFSEWRASQVIDADGGIILPGLINTHTHAAMTCFRGLADDLQLMSWLNDHIFPAEAKLDEQKVYSGTLLACAEMILSGTTCFCDMYLFEDTVARAASAAGRAPVTSASPPTFARGRSTQSWEMSTRPSGCRSSWPARHPLRPLSSCPPGTSRASPCRPG